MGELPLHEEESLRFATPRLYERMVETFSKYNLHPYDTEATVRRKHDSIDISIKLTGNAANLASTTISLNQANEPDEEVNTFFETSAEECKNLLIKDYFKMIKL